MLQFENLQKEFEIDSVDELHTDKFANFDIKFLVPQNINDDDIENKHKLKATMKFLDTIFIELKKQIVPKKGSDFIAANFKQFFAEPKTKTINKNNRDESIAKTNCWYVLDGFVGTSEEKELIKFIKEKIGNLNEKYSEIYLLKNEEVYKIFDFQQGRGFQPDFLLFLKTKAKEKIKDKEQSLYYQIFIESKGKQFQDKDNLFDNSKEGWKEEFLKEITKKYGAKNVIIAENSNYRLFGLPFFSASNNQKFISEYSQFL